MRPTQLLALALAGLLGAGCASVPRHPDEAGPASTTRDRNVLTRADLNSATDRSLYDAIARQRSTWLIRRGATTLGNASGEGQIRVYLDGVQMGGPSALRQITVENVREARFLSSADATTRFGINHQHGAIVVESRR